MSKTARRKLAVPARWVWRTIRRGGFTAPIRAACRRAMLYDGADVIAEYDGAGALLRRYVHGAGEDEPLVSYDSAGNRSWLLADAQGSIIALTNSAGAATAINTYDEYGRPGASNSGYFQYTGQGWLAQAGLGCERFSVSQWIGGCSGVQNGARSLLSGDGARGPA
ncbi:MAG TPA: hypothetical protein VG735_05095 [Caulobacterales bacterium]|nr:hypothetical protein [Caulobacterales bacterium]